MNADERAARDATIRRLWGFTPPPTMVELAKQFGLTKQRVYQILVGVRAKERAAGGRCASSGLDTERRVLAYILEHTSKAGWPPGLREIARGVGLRSCSTSHQYLRRLAAKGYVRLGGGPRMIAVVAMPQDEEGR